MSIEIRLFGIPVRIHVWFLIVGFLLGMSLPEVSQSAIAFVGFIAIVFLAVLGQQLGHAITGRAFGWTPSIELVAMGGFTRFEGIESGKPWQRILMLAAGPFVNGALGLVCLLSFLRFGDALPAPASLLLRLAAQIELIWAALNLLPILPLDGGQILLEGMRALAPERGPHIAGAIMLVVVGVITFFGVTQENLVLVAVAVFSGIGAYRLARDGTLSREGDHRSLREQAYFALARRDGKRLVALAGKLVAAAEDVDAFDEAFHLLAWGRLFAGEPAEAKRALAAISRAHATTHALEGAIALELGDPDKALEQFEKILPRLNPWLEDYFVRAILLSRRWDEARTLFEDELGREFSVPSLLTVMTAARADGALEAAEAMREMLVRKASAQAQALP